MFAPITQDEDKLPTRVNNQHVPRRSQRLQEQATMIFSPRVLASISPQALYLYLDNAVFDTPEWSIPNNLMNEELPTTPQIDIEEYANGVVHPDTKETITEYKTLIEDPLLKDKWKKAMCVELGRLAQGYQDIPGTNTIKFMTHEEIKSIPTDRTVTYAPIVVDYCAHKDDPKRVRMIVGGNLIKYPGELTTRTAC